MRRIYNGKAGGSAEYLAGIALEELCRELRGGDCPADGTEEALCCARELWQAVCACLPEVKNLSLHTTLKSIEAFWNIYPLRFFAQGIPCDVDYQLCRPVPEKLLGVEYLERTALGPYPRLKAAWDDATALRGIFLSFHCDKDRLKERFQ